MSFLVMNSMQKYETEDIKDDTTRKVKFKDPILHDIRPSLKFSANEVDSVDARIALSLSDSYLGEDMAAVRSLSRGRSVSGGGQSVSSDDYSGLGPDSALEGVSPIRLTVNIKEAIQGSVLGSRVGRDGAPSHDLTARAATEPSLTKEMTNLTNIFSVIASQQKVLSFYCTL